VFIGIFNSSVTTLPDIPWGSSPPAAPPHCPYGDKLSHSASLCRKLSLKYHPDKNKDPKAVDRFSDIARAYEVRFEKTKIILLIFDVGP
jgi:hypothetical protein